MEIIKLRIEGAALVRYKPFSDNRGTFQETYNWETFSDAGLPHRFLQDNLSMSKKGVLRGMHIQRNLPQGKLLRCLEGEIWDVFIDLRKESPTFRQWEGVFLNEHQPAALYVPEGCAHGFYSVTDSTVYYKCTTLYDKTSDGGVNPFDPSLGIAWPSKRPIMSDKDSRLPSVDQWLKEHHGTQD